MMCMNSSIQPARVELKNVYVVFQWRVFGQCPKRSVKSLCCHPGPLTSRQRVATPRQEDAILRLSVQSMRRIASFSPAARCRLAETYSAVNLGDPVNDPGSHLLKNILFDKLFAPVGVKGNLAHPN